MKFIKSRHYLIDTDIVILTKLFDQLKKVGITDYDQLIKRLNQLNIVSFDDLLEYLSDFKCDDKVAVMGEMVLERLRMAVYDRDAVLTSSNEVGMYLTDKLANRKQEELWAIYIDNSNHIIAEKCLFRGTLDKSVAHPREIFRWALIYACAGVFVVHNHPSGKLVPSKSDLELTKLLHSASDMLHIDFLDHFIVGKGHYLSMREHQLF
ncbi:MULTISPECIES: JAB domain-containing protein [Lactobacillus]|uniref:DNA repair protein RadC n=1 Tax=Lactobacillus apis TaxID=303541 RepID=A0A0F4LRW0_9LACO|nr:MULTISPECIES: JAB domain-containing protein [Lactobacillus]KJY61295.1 DNA repair protein RadC [Lactobacillus apis]MBI0022077.1 DNA repair protein RadC [Lactobacillus sp. W8172]MBI0093172.1 DNA repair protein RadC [Lactobacillus sp. M0403]WLS85495.1 JAB domain-containing protein [Lactobacillus apis]